MGGLDKGGLKSSANSTKLSKVRAIFKSDSKEIIPVCSNFLITPKLTPDFSDKLSWLKLKKKPFFLRPFCNLFRNFKGCHKISEYHHIPYIENLMLKVTIVYLILSVE